MSDAAIEMSVGSMKAQNVFREYEDLKLARKEIEALIKDAKQNDAIYASAEEEFKAQQEAFKEEKNQFKAKNPALFDKLDEAKKAEKEAKLLWDEHALIAYARGEQLEIFSKDGDRVLWQFATKLVKDGDQPVE